nr:glycosyl hydrolase [Actinomycetales bacterium]
DVVVVMAGVIATEGADMPAPRMSHGQDEMVEAVLDAVPGAVVVLKNSTPVLVPWIERAPTVLEVWNQGTEDGHVVPDLLFGLVNPSGKVPTTYAAREADLLYHEHPERHPGVDEGEGFPTIRYSEGLEMGYRRFQSQGRTPLFPFGYGLSYTTFDVTNVSLSQSRMTWPKPFDVRARVTNTGDRAGAEVVQVYLGIPLEGQPPMRLVGFAKVGLEPGESREVTIRIDPGATNHPLSVWDYGSSDFVVWDGEYTVYVGTSTEDIAGELVLTLG